MSRADESALREAVERLAESWVAWDKYARTNYGEETEGPAYAAALRLILAEHPATPAVEVAEVAVEEREAAIRRSLARLLVDEYGETPRDWCELGSVRRIARALSDEIATHDAALTAKAKAEGRVEALREAADDSVWDYDGDVMRIAVRQRLHEMADREAT